MNRRATGRCLCGAVTYEVRGPLRDIMVCHCVECRRWSGYLGAFTSTLEEHLELLRSGALRWVVSPDSDRRAQRGFCGECGSSLFWKPAESERVNIAVGTLDRPTGLERAGHWYAHQAGDYDQLLDDGLSKDPDGRTLRWS